jgi:hypothetical protein
VSALRSRERPALVAEQLGLREGSGQRGAIDGVKPTLTTAESMDGSRDAFLAATGGSDDQDRDVGRGRRSRKRKRCRERGAAEQTWAELAERHGLDGSRLKSDDADEVPDANDIPVRHDAVIDSAAVQMGPVATAEVPERVDRPLSIKLSVGARDRRVLQPEVAIGASTDPKPRPSQKMPLAVAVGQHPLQGQVSAGRRLGPRAAGWFRSLARRHSPFLPWRRARRPPWARGAHAPASRKGEEMQSRVERASYIRAVFRRARVSVVETVETAIPSSSAISLFALPRSASTKIWRSLCVNAQVSTEFHSPPVG